MANSFRGTNIEFGIKGTTLTGSLIGGTLKLQSRDHTRQSDADEVRDEEGIVVQKSYYNQNEAVQVEYVVTGGTGTDAGTLAAASLTIPTPGSRCTLANARYTLCDGSNWFVSESGASTRGSNTGALRVTIPLEKFEGIS